MVKVDKATWKSNYFMRLIQHLDDYEKCFIVTADNVGSKQMQSIRVELRKMGQTSLLFGKNTMMRKAIRGHLENNPHLEKLLPCLKGNIGFVFTKQDLNDVRKCILENKVKAPAKAGAIAPLNVVVPKQNTGMGPEKTSFFQALNIQTKITKGTVEIMNDVKLLQEGDKVGPSEAALLNMLNISPFSYGLVIDRVYENGTVYDPAILDISDNDLRNMFMQGVSNIASVCLEVGFPTVASVPHSIANGFKNCLAIAVETDYTFKQAEMTKAYLADPSAFASAAPAASSAAAAAPKEEAKKEESEEESDDDMGFGLFD